MDLWHIKTERCPVCADMAVCDTKGIKNCGHVCDEIREFGCGSVLGHNYARNVVEFLKVCPNAEEQRHKRKVKDAESVKLMDFILSLNMDQESISEIMDSLPCDVRDARR